MPNPKKPMALRELHGTAHRNKQRNNNDAPEPARGIGPAPDYFDDAHVKVWDYLVTIMHPGVLAEPDRPTFEVMVKLFFRFRHGVFEKPDPEDEGPHYPALNGAELARMTGLMSLYGMTPSDRQKIVVPKAKERNPFDM